MSKGFIDRPMFDTSYFKVGEAVRTNVDSSASYALVGEERSIVGQLSSGDCALITKVEPLAISLLVNASKIVKVPIEVVYGGAVILTRQQDEVEVPGVPVDPIP